MGSKGDCPTSPRLPIFVAVDLGGSHGMVGLIASCYPIAQFLGSTPVGVVSLDGMLEDYENLMVLFSGLKSAHEQFVCSLEMTSYRDRVVQVQTE